MRSGRSRHRPAAEHARYGVRIEVFLFIPMLYDEDCSMKLLLTLKQLNAGEILSIAAVMLMVLGVAYGFLA